MSSNVIPFPVPPSCRLSDQRMFDLLERANHGRLRITLKIRFEYCQLIPAIVRHKPEAQEGSQRLIALLEEYDAHLRRSPTPDVWLRHS
jgi:hypothetical protein